MISSFQNVHQEFLKQICGGALNSTIVMQDYRGNNLNVYFATNLKSADNPVEAVRDKYPSLIVTHYAPEFRPGFRPDEKPFYTNPRDTNNDNVADTITQGFEPLAMQFKFEVNIYASNDRDFFAMQQYLIKKFEYRTQKFFDFNVNPANTDNTVWGPETDGEKVEYKFRHVVDPIRSDAIRESLYEFMVFPYVYVKDPVDLPLIQDLNIGYSGNIENF